MRSEIDIWSSAATQSRALRQRHISVSELLDLYREGIQRFNPQLNAIVVDCLDAAAERALQVDSLPKDQVPLPLAGLPMTIKESIEVKGLPTCGGVLADRDRRSTVDAPHARALLEAGMTLMGKTNIPSACADWQANSPVYGRTNNPWNLERSPGGSSGGSAAALAAGLTPLEIGTDIGGSVRVPANFCGVYGLRPSETAVPRYGDYPGGSGPNPSVVMSVFGPLARYPADLEVALDIISGPDFGEDAGWKLEIRPARHEALADFRVGILSDIDWVPLSNDVRSAVQTVRQTLESIGAKVTIVDAEELFGGTWAHHLTYTSLLMAIMGPDVTDEDRALVSERLRDRPELLAAVNASFDSPPATVFEWHGKREQQRALYRQLFKRLDVLISPITLRTAFEHITEGRPLVDLYTRTIGIDGQVYPYDLQLVYPAVSTLSGQPSVAFPTGIGSDGLPIGLQAIGPYLEDRTPIRFAELLAEEIGRFAPPPGYD
jgi:amidase